MIDVETIVLRDLMMTLEQTNNRIDEAVATLNSIHSHNDWGCPERHAINEFIIENAASILQLKEDCFSFAAATRTVVDEFCEVEKGIASLFDSVDGAIKGILAMPVAKVVIHAADTVGAKNLGTIGLIPRNTIRISGRHK